MINNRQNGRRRGRGGQRVGGNPGRPESGNRIDNRARGNASQLHEKYKALAADAQRQGDRVNTEYYLQFADHYFRVLAESRPRVDEREAQRRGRDEFDDDFDGEGEEYGQEGESGQPDQIQPRADDRPRQDARQDGRRGGEGRPSQDRQVRDGEDRPRRDDRPRQDEARQDERPRREDRPRREAGQDRRPREDRRDEAPAPSVQGLDQAPVAAQDQLTQPQPATEAASTPRAADMDEPAPRRRGRPPRVRAEEAPAPEATGFDADRLPPSLSVSASAEPDTAPDEGEPAEKPRRRRRLSTGSAEAGSAS